MRTDNGDAGLASVYGSPLAGYDGEGTLTLSDGRKHKCRFHVAQLSDGSVVLLCDFIEPYPDSLRISATRFDGVTNEGYPVTITHDLVETNYLPDPPSDRDSSFLAAFLALQLCVHIDGQSPTRQVRFGITNFDFVGTSAVRSSSGNVYLSLPLLLAMPGAEIATVIEPVRNHDYIVQQTRTLKGTNVTCEAIVNVNTMSEVGMLADVMSDLCQVLSIARGTKIQWVYCDHYAQDGVLVRREHSSRVTKPFSPLQVIDARAGGRHETKAFIESAFPLYVQRRDAFTLDRGTVDTYLDAKAEGDYLEIRAVKMAVAVEVMTNVFIAQPDCGIQRTIIPEAEFEKVKKPLREAIVAAMQQVGIDSAPIDQLCSKIVELNRTSFRKVIRRLCAYVGLVVDDREVGLFVACRNSLIHQGQFHCATATTTERQKIKPLPSKTHEFFFLVNIVDRLFLALLGYNGPYIDWRSPNNPIRGEFRMRR